MRLLRDFRRPDGHERRPVFGSSVALEGDRVLIGARGDDTQGDAVGRRI